MWGIFSALLSQYIQNLTASHHLHCRALGLPLSSVAGWLKWPASRRHCAPPKMTSSSRSQSLAQIAPVLSSKHSDASRLTQGSPGPSHGVNQPLQPGLGLPLASSPTSASVGPSHTVCLGHTKQFLLQGHCTVPFLSSNALPRDPHGSPPGLLGVCSGVPFPKEFLDQNV